MNHLTIWLLYLIGLFLLVALLTNRSLLDPFFYAYLIAGIALGGWLVWRRNEQPTTENADDEQRPSRPGPVAYRDFPRL